MRILEIIFFAVESVCGFEIARLHIVVDVLDVHHFLFVKVQVYIMLFESTYALYFLGKHREVEFCGIVAGEIGIPEPFHHLISDFIKLGAVSKVLILDSVHCRSSRGDGALRIALIVPGADFPGFDALLSSGKNLDEAQFYDAVYRYI